MERANAISLFWARCSGKTRVVAPRERWSRLKSRKQNLVIRVYDKAGNVIETHEHRGEFKEW